jgi:hypothetical protein
MSSMFSEDVSMRSDRELKARNKLSDLQRDLVRVPGIRSARVVGAKSPSEIHIVATPGRPPKQIARDVQTLAEAGFALHVDRRIISVVQLSEETEPRPTLKIVGKASEPARPAIERILSGSEGRSRWVKVILGWPNGDRSEGRAKLGVSTILRARGGATAAVEALDSYLAARESRLEVEHVVVQRIGPDEIVLLRASYYEGEESLALTGSALIGQDAVEAGVRALLDAVNRKLIRAAGEAAERS